MVAPGSDWSDSVAQAALKRAEQIAIVLDGVPSEAMERSVAAYQLAFSLYADRFQKTLAHLRSLPDSAIVLVDSKLVKSHRLMHIMGLPHRLVDSIRSISDRPEIVFVGCQDSGSLPGDTITDLLADGVTLVTSDKSALAEPIRDVLQPTNPRPAHVARVRWLEGDPLSVGGSTSFDPYMLPGVQLSAGHIPVATHETAAEQIDVLAINAITNEPVIVHAQIGRGRVVHAVPHWWQQDAAVRTVVDRRRLNVMPSFAQLGSRTGDVTFGELQAARTMLRGLLTGLGPTAG